MRLKWVGINESVCDDGGGFFLFFFSQGQLCDVEPSQDDGRSPAVLGHPGPREGRVEEILQGPFAMTETV